MKHLKRFNEEIVNWSEYAYDDAKDYLDLEFVDFLNPIDGKNKATSNMDSYGYYNILIPIPLRLDNNFNSKLKEDLDELKEVLCTHINQLKRIYPNIRGNILFSKDEMTQNWYTKLVLRNEEVRTPTILNKTNRYPIFGRR